MSMVDQCKREVAELHEFFGQWFNGDLPATEQVLGRFESVLAPAFRMITPNGDTLDRTEVVDLVRAGHPAASRERPPGQVRVWIENHQHLIGEAEAALVSYEEWQSRVGQTRGRVVTALFIAKPTAPNGVEWFHLHETWLPRGPRS